MPREGFPNRVLPDVGLREYGRGQFRLRQPARGRPERGRFFQQRGESYSYSVDDGSYFDSSAYWWDGPTAQSYGIVPNAAPSVTFTPSCIDRNCTFDASGSFDSDGSIATYSWDFGDGLGVTQAGSSTEAWHAYSADGTYTVTLTATDDQGATASVSRTVAVATNTPPIASFTFSCSGPSCSFDGSGSTDSDGTIAAYSWSFGDGTSASGKLAQHVYTQPGSFTVALAVTDNDGATATQSKAVTVISLTAHGYKVKGLQKVDLSWSGSNAATFDVLRNGMKIATVSTAAYTDTVGKGPGTYTYRVCEVGSATCSNEATVRF